MHATTNTCCLTSAITSQALNQNWFLVTKKSQGRTAHKVLEQLSQLRLHYHVQKSQCLAVAVQNLPLASTTNHKLLTSNTASTTTHIKHEFSQLLQMQISSQRKVNLGTQH
jgi:hypothetical protein